MLSLDKRNDQLRSSMGDHLDATRETKSLIARLTQLRVKGEDDDSSCDIIGTMKIDTRRLLSEPFSMRINFTEPIRKGYYSVSYDRFRNMDFIQDTSALRYLHCPQNGRVNMNLLSGFDPDRQGGGGGRRKGPHSSPHKMHFLKWLTANQKDLITDHLEMTDGQDPAAIANTFADFVCSANILQSIMSTPYILSEGTWSVVAIKIRGIIYLVESKPERHSNTDHQPSTNYQPLTRPSSYSTHVAAASYAGLKFKEMISCRHDGSHDMVNFKGNRDSFWTVCQTNVGLSHRVLYNVRTECALDNQQLKKTIDEASFVELRTRPSNINEYRWENRAINWWLSALISGIDTIFCGERDRDFFVRKVTKIFVDSLPKPWYKWSPKTCVDFLDDTLTFIKSKVTDEMIPYRFNNTDDQVICTKLDDPVDHFIPSGFIEHTKYEVRDFITWTEEEEDDDDDSDGTRDVSQSDIQTEVKSETD